MCERVGVCVGAGGRWLALSPAPQCPGVVRRRRVGMAGVNDDLQEALPLKKRWDRKMLPSQLTMAIPAVGSWLRLLFMSSPKAFCQKQPTSSMSSGQE